MFVQVPHGAKSNQHAKEKAAENDVSSSSVFQIGAKSPVIVVTPRIPPISTSAIS